MKILKQQNYIFILFPALVLVGLFVLSDLTDADTKNPSIPVASESLEKEINVKDKPRKENNVNSGSPTFFEIEKNLKTYFHKELGYSFKYPENWLLGTYKSNGYEAVGLWDPIAQKQRGEGHLTRGVKIEISACDCVPEIPLKNTILRQSVFTPETITEISESPFDFYRDGSTALVVRTNFKTEHGGGKGVYFIGRDGRYYVLTFGSPDFRTITDRQLKEYELIFEEIAQSFTFD